MLIFIPAILALLLKNVFFIGILLLLTILSYEYFHAQANKKTFQFAKFIFLLGGFVLVVSNICSFFIEFGYEAKEPFIKIFSFLDLIKLKILILVLFSAFIAWRNADKKTGFNIKLNKTQFYIIFGTILLIGFFLRTWNLNDLAPFKDEFSHLLSPRNIHNGNPMFEMRGYFINYLNLALFKLFNIDPNNLFADYTKVLFLIRMPSVVVGTITIFIFYKIGNKYNQLTGLILAFLLAIFPLHIALSKMSREYVWFFLIFALDILFAQKILKELPKTKEIKNLIKKNKAIMAFFLIQVIDAFLIEPDSTLKLIVFMFGSLFLVASSFYYYRNPKKIFSKNSLSIIITAILSLTLLIYKFHNHIGFDFSQRYFDIMTNANQSHFFANYFALFPLFFIIISLAGFILSYKQNKTKKLTVSFFAIFLISNLVFFAYLFNRYIQIRYTYTFFIPYLILISTGFYTIFYFLKKYLNIPVFITGILTFFTLLSPYNIIYAGKFNENNAWSRVTEHYNQEITSFLGFFIEQKIAQETPVITSYPNMIGAFTKAENILFYDIKTGEKRFDLIHNTIQNYDQGWIVLDWRRNGLWAKGLPKKDFYTNGIYVEKVTEVDKFTVYRWNKNIDLKTSQ